MHAVDLDKTPYWSDCQTNEQYFGLLSFDPGSEYFTPVGAVDLRSGKTPVKIRGR